MYTEIATFYFLPSIPQSARFGFLEKISKDLEAAIETTIKTDNPGFSVEIEKGGKTKIIIWHPWKASTLYKSIDAGIKLGLISMSKQKS